MIAIVATTNAFGQKKMSKNAIVEAQLIALEKAGWEAWKNKDAAWFQANTTEECLLINSEGISDKTQVIKSTSTDCEVNRFSLDNFKFVMLNENTALLVYTAMQDAVCNEKKIPSSIRASVAYVKRGGKWLESFYMETPMSQ